MKKATETANTIDKSSQLTDQQVNEMENDKLWDLLDEADSSVEASPLFSRNVMREIRNLDGNNESIDDSTSFWQRIISHNFAKYGLGIAAAAVCAFLVTTKIPSANNDENFTDAKKVNDIEFLNDIPLDSLAEYSEGIEPSTEEDAFTTEILALADQDPLFMSEEDIDLAMNF